MTESNRQKCDEMFKLIAIEVFYVAGCNYSGMVGFAMKNNENPERTSLVEKHMKAIRLLVDCTNALMDVEITLKPMVSLHEHASAFLKLMDEISQKILGNLPHVTISQILEKISCVPGKICQLNADS
jgi:hypothetical protein